jgi:hypothetical protein
VLTLIAKNVRHDALAMVVGVSFGLVLSFIDARLQLAESDGFWLFQEGSFWIVVHFSVILAGLAAGAGAFSADSKNESLHFLDYLPIGRPRIWLANAVTAVVWLSVYVVAISWWRVLVSGPEHGELLTAFVGQGRWAFLIGPLALGLWCLALGLFMRVLVVRENTAMMPALVIVLGCTLLSIIGAGTAEVLPTQLDAAPLLLLSGVLFAAGSLWIFVLHPPHHRDRRALLLAVPLGVGVLVAAGGLAAWFGHRWIELDLAEQPEINGVKMVRPDRLLVRVSTRRMLEHHLLVDVASGRRWYVGRSLKEFNGPDGKLAFLERFAPGALWPHPAWPVLYDLDDARREEVWREGVWDFLGRAPVFRYPDVWSTPVAWTADGRFLVVSDIHYRQKDGMAPQRYVVILDRTGREILNEETPIAGEPMIGPQGQVVALAAQDRVHGRKLRDPVHLLWLDPSRASSEELQPPGEVLVLSHDLDQAVCMVTRVQGQQLRRRVVLVELPDGDVRELLSEHDLMPVTLAPWEIEQGLPAPAPFLGRAPHHQVGDHGRLAPRLRFDPSLEHAVWLERRLRGEFIEHRFVLIDTISGEREVLVDSDDLPRAHVSRPGVQLEYAFHFTTDGQALVATEKGQRWLLQLETGQREPTVSADVGERHHRFSPDERRFVHWPRREHEGEHALELVETAGSQVLYRSAQPIGTVVWVDDRQIAFSSGDHVYLVVADAGKAAEPRRLL